MSEEDIALQSSSRIRKPAIKPEDFIVATNDITDAVKSQQRILLKIAREKKKRKAIETPSAITTTKINPKKVKVIPPPPQTAKQREQNEREQQFLNAFEDIVHDYNTRYYIQRKLKEDTWEVGSLKEAILEGIKSSTLLLDWTLPALRKIGQYFSNVLLRFQSILLLF